MPDMWLHYIAPMPRIVNHTQCDHHWVEPQRVIYDHELMLFGKGNGVVIIDSTSFPCPSESFLIIPPGQWESSHVVHAPWHRHWVHFDWVYQGDNTALPISTMYPQQPDVHLLHAPPAFVPGAILHGPLRRPGHVFDLFMRLEQRWNYGSAHDRVTCRGLLTELLLEVLDDQHDVPQSSDGAATQLAGRLREGLEELSRQPMGAMPSIQEFLEEFGCSYAHAARLFRRTYGLSPVGYINALRVERAKLLLRDTDATISAIAYQIGVEDPAYFTRLFIRHTGVNPSTFRSQQQA